MAEIHQLIVHHGIEEARRQAASKHERLLVEAAYRVLSEDAEKMGFTYSGFALTSLPHKPQAATTWRREGHNLTLVLQAGVDRREKSIGLPYGSYARFILLFLQTEAIRTGSREIELGGSMNRWLGSMGLSSGGKTYRLVSEQARRISGCRLTFFADRQGHEIRSQGGFVKTAISMSGMLGDQPGLWQDKVLLDEDFYRALREHPVPLSESALRAIGPRS
ncbi:MAG: replication protein RepA, partial [Acidobacteriota bacterium]